MISIATDSVDEEEVIRPVHYDVRRIIFLATMLGIVSTLFDFLFFAVFKNGTPGTLQTNWFIGSVLTELVFLFSIRTKRFFLRASRPPLSIVILTIAAAIGCVAIPFTNMGRAFFRFQSPTYEQILLVVILVVSFFISTEAAKLFFVRTMRNSAGKRAHQPQTTSS